MKKKVAALKSEVLALYLASRHPGTPWAAKLLVAAIVAYALSPVDLIPDFIPVLGYLDELILLPLAIALAIRLIPAAVLEECRTQARISFQGNRPINYLAGALIVILWIGLAGWFAAWAFRATAA